MKHLILFIALFCLAAPTVATAAGSSGGGGDYGSSAPSGRKSPEDIAASHFRSGVRHRDRAHKFEEKAAAASSDKKRDNLMAKAQKEYGKAIKRQTEALKVDPTYYKSANEMGYALRKTGDYRKAIGAYNYALELNPNFFEAIEYRGEALLALGFVDQTKQAYMRLFRNKPSLAGQLMTAMDAWVVERQAAGEDVAEFATWLKERKSLARITRDLSQNNTRTW